MLHNIYRVLFPGIKRRSLSVVVKAFGLDFGKRNHIFFLEKKETDRFIWLTMNDPHIIRQRQNKILTS